MLPREREPAIRAVRALRHLIGGLAVLAIALVAAGCGGRSSGVTPASVSSSTLMVTTRPSSTTTTPAPSRSAPPSGFTEVGMESPAGHKCILVADTDAARQKGLMGFTTIAPWDGMLFTFDGATVHQSFYMKNTLIPLDIVFMGSDGTAGVGLAGVRLVQEVLVMEPCPPEVSQCPLYKPARPYTTALEVEKGRAATFGLTAGAQVTVGGAC